MQRIFNYTNRRRITSEMVSVSLQRVGDGMEFAITMDLTSHGLPNGARVYVEAFQGSSYMRFDFGTVGHISIPSDRRMISIDDPESAYFRVKVVDESEKLGRLLAAADQLWPSLPGESTRSLRPILRMRTALIGDQIWRMSFADDVPTVELNERIPYIMYTAKRDPDFFGLVIPVVIRLVLMEAVFRRDADVDDDAGDWPSQWMTFAATYCEPEWHTKDVEDEIKLQWIEDVVDKFCARHRVISRFGKSSA